MKSYRRLLLVLVGIAIIITHSIAIEAPIISDAIAFLQIDIKASDSGISWLYKQWVNTPRKSAIREIAAKLTPQAGIIALYPAKEIEKLQYSAILTFPRTVDTDDRFTTFVGNALKPDLGTGYSDIKYIQHDKEIYFATNTANKNNIGYAFLGPRAVIGNNLSTLQSTVQVLKQRQNSITTQTDFIQLKKRLTMTPDILIYCNNNQQQFAQFLSPREKKWKMSLLLSAKDVRAILIGLDAVDADKLQGTIIFKAANMKAIPEIMDDAEFLKEAIRRKFIAEKIKWNSKVTTSGDYVTLQFDAAGLKPLWLDLFKSGGLSVVK